MGLDAMILVSECWVLSQLFHSSLTVSSRGSIVLFRFLLAEAETPILQPHDAKKDSLEKNMMLGTIVGRMRWLDGITKVDGHELEEALRIGDGWGNMACCSPWVAKSGTRRSDWTELGWNENCRLGGRISDSSEGLLQSGSGGRSMYKVLVKGEFNATEHSFYKRFLANHEDLI